MNCNRARISAFSYQSCRSPCSPVYGAFRVAVVGPALTPGYGDASISFSVVGSESPLQRASRRLGLEPNVDWAEARGLVKPRERGWATPVAGALTRRQRRVL